MSKHVYCRPRSSTTTSNGDTTARTLLNDATERLLQEALADDLDEARLQAELLYAHTTSQSRAQVLAAGSDSPTPSIISRFQNLLDRRMATEPLAYILGEREFYGIRFEVGPGVLIPRPETETLVEATLRAMQDHPRQDNALRVADVGTGCGSVALAVATHSPEAIVIATESSTAALPWANRNRYLLGLNKRVTILAGELLDPVSGPIDLVAANLPYVPTIEYEALPSAIRNHEPREAVDGGEDGLTIIRAMINQFPARLAQDASAVLLEVGAGQASEVAELLTKSIGGEALMHRDLLGTRRVVEVRIGY